MLDEPLTFWRGAADAVGLVKFAYHTAATVGRYVITVDRETRRLRLGGTLVASDAYLLTQAPLVFVVATKFGARRWPIQSVTVTADGQLSAELLEKE